ncbi:unnamed protein product [Linum tenue]|uniref:Uncharacterized protein n=1 Tax=Linum tenue TaxID=586396 RepID=A0AAV0P2Y7_9ROSI|nr:unnamed protein product [Linum tenue]
MLAGINQKIGDLDVTVYEFATLEGNNPAQNLTSVQRMSHVSDVSPLKGSVIHELEQDLDLIVVVIHFVTTLGWLMSQRILIFLQI